MSLRPKSLDAEGAVGSLSNIYGAQKTHPASNGQSKHSREKVSASLEGYPIEEKRRLLTWATQQGQSLPYRHWEKVAQNHPDISVDVWVNHGRPTISGTRIPVSSVIGLLCHQEKREVVETYPEIDPDTLNKIIDFAIDVLGE